MLEGQHLVKKNVFHGASRHARMVEAPIQQDLVRPGIVTAKLPPPRAQTPTDMRPLQFYWEILAVQFVKEFLQIEVSTLCAVVALANATSEHADHADAR